MGKVLVWVVAVLVAIAGCFAIAGSMVLSKVSPAAGGISGPGGPSSVGGGISAETLADLRSDVDRLLAAESAWGGAKAADALDDVGTLSTRLNELELKLTGAPVVARASSEAMVEVCRCGGCCGNP